MARVKRTPRSRWGGEGMERGLHNVFWTIFCCCWFCVLLFGNDVRQLQGMLWKICFYLIASALSFESILTWFSQPTWLVNNAFCVWWPVKKGARFGIHKLIIIISNMVFYRFKNKPFITCVALQAVVSCVYEDVGGASIAIALVVSTEI